MLSSSILSVGLIQDLQQHAGFADRADHTKHAIISNSTISDPQENTASLMGIDNLAEVQVRDLFECYKCNMTFDEKDVYFEHLLSFHPRTTKRFRLGTSVGEGVIIKDGKYECQFCHKAFIERRSYNGHVGNHVKKFVRNSKELAGQLAVEKSIKSPPQHNLPSRISKMDALIEIAQNSILETSTDGLNGRSNGGSSPKRALNQEISQHDSENMTTGERIVRNDSTSDVGNDINVVCVTTPKDRKLYKVEKYGNSEVDMGFGNRHVKSNHDVVANTIKKTAKENMIQGGGITDSSMQSIHQPPAFTAIPNKVMNIFFYLVLNQVL